MRFSKNDELLNLKTAVINGTDHKYCENVLISLGLKKAFILFNNHFFFGYRDLYNQDIIQKKFKTVVNVFEVHLKKLYKKYSCEQLVIALGGIYSKLEDIRLMNAHLKTNQTENLEIIQDIVYGCSVADLMGRKIKCIIETAVLKNNKKRFIINFTNLDYKRFVILLYYYSIFMFYDSRKNLSKKYENGITDFYIFPNDLNSLNTVIANKDNNISKTYTHYNYDSGIGNNVDECFNNAFRIEKGISFKEFNNLMNGIIKSCKEKNLVKSKIQKEQFDSILLKNYKDINLERFHNTCVLTNLNIENKEEKLYKNNGKYRLDTTPLIDIGKDYYIVIKGFISNSQNYWNNVHAIGLTPYLSESKDSIQLSSEKIIKKITKMLENDIVKIFKTINLNVEVYMNKKTKDIFSSKNIQNNEWDIIVVDHINKFIFNTEAKFISTSLTESGLSNDLKKIVGDSKNSYVSKFEKRIKIIKEHKNEFLTFCKANDSYRIENLMVTSKFIELDVESSSRNFKIIHYDRLKKYLLKTYYNEKKS